MSQMYFPTREEFIALFNLFPKGNPESVFREVKYTITTAKAFDGTPVTWQLIEKSYSAYIKKRKDDETQEKFIKSLESFLKSKDYNIDFEKEPSMKQKDRFETGLDDSFDELERRLSSYKNDNQEE